MDNKLVNNNFKNTSQNSDVVELDDSFVIISSEEDESPQVPSSSDDVDVTQTKVQNDVRKRLRNYAEIVEQLNIFKVIQTIDELIVLFSCHDVRLYVNYPNGIVDLIHNNATLRVIQFNETCTYRLSFCLLIIDSVRHLEWIYPLDKDSLHCFCTSYGAFILPELPAQHRQHIQHVDGVTYGLVIPKPANEIVLEILEGILNDTIREIPKDWSALRDSSINVVSNSIVKNSYYISSGLISGAEKLGEFLGQGATLLTSNLEPTPVNQQPVVPQKLKAGMEVTKSVTGAAGNITGKCASAIGSATMSIGRYLAPHIQSKLPTLLSRGFGISQQASEKSVNNVLAVAGGTVEGVSNIYSGIEQSVTILGKTVANNVVKIIEHKYGENYGSVAETTFDTAGNVINISQNVSLFTPKGLVKKTAKGAGIAFVKECKPSTSAGTNGDLTYPDVSGLIKELENDRVKTITTVQVSSSAASNNVTPEANNRKLCSEVTDQIKVLDHVLTNNVMANSDIILPDVGGLIKDLENDRVQKMITTVQGSSSPASNDVTPEANIDKLYPEVTDQMDDLVPTNIVMAKSDIIYPDVGGLLKERNNDKIEKID